MVYIPILIVYVKKVTALLSDSMQNTSNRLRPGLTGHDLPYKSESPQYKTATLILVTREVFRE